MLYRWQETWTTLAEAHASVVDFIPRLTDAEQVLGPVLEWEGLEASKFPPLLALLPPATPLELGLEGDRLGDLWPEWNGTGDSTPPFWPLREGESLAVFFGEYGSLALCRHNGKAGLKIHCDFANPRLHLALKQPANGQKMLTPQRREALLQGVLEHISKDQAAAWSRQVLHQSTPCVSEGGWKFEVNTGGLGWSNDAVSFFPEPLPPSAPPEGAEEGAEPVLDERLLPIFRRALGTLPTITGWRARLRRSAVATSELAELQGHLVEVGSGRGERFKNYQLQARVPQEDRLELTERVLSPLQLEALWQLEPELACRLQLHWNVRSWVCGAGGEQHPLEAEPIVDNSLELVRNRKGQVEMFISVEGKGVPRKAIKIALEGCLSAPLKAVL